MKDKIKFFLNAALLYITLILATLLITFPIINSAYGQVTQDLGGDWQIDTSTDDQIEYPYLQLIKSYNPFKDTSMGPMLSGRVTSSNCGSLIDIKKAEAKKRVDLLIKKVRKIVNDKYTVTISVFICYDWYIIYLHDKTKFASKPIYDKVWEVIKPND